jgi:hypothetical protein
MHREVHAFDFGHASTPRIHSGTIGSRPQ